MNKLSYALMRCCVWLCRFRHRRGYGIHSPFAFGLVTKVFYERGTFYAYAPLRKMRRQIAHDTTERGDRLMLRIINAFQPADCFIGGERTQLTTHYLRAGKPSCRFWPLESLDEAEGLDMLYLDMPDWEQWATKALAKMRDKGCIVVRGIHRNARMLKAWQRLTKQKVVRVSFDLYDYGVACFHQDLHKQDYIICF